MPLAPFHPAVRRWFSETLGEPTPAQAQGWAAIREGRHTLIAAPTGSGKTLAAFLNALDDLFQEAAHGPLPDEVRVVYISPLKALSADIHKNLAEPRLGIRRLAEEMGLEAPRVTAGVRTGDTTTAERAAMLKTPPHILVTTPESLYLLLTAERSREMLRTARTVIVDEIHAVIGTRRGAHLALTLERLQQVAERPLLRLGLSATQKPIEEVARYLTGGSDDCAIVDEGHRRAMDLSLETPRSMLDAVMSHEVWEDYYDRLTALIESHKTTLVFVNTRRMAERVARHLSDRLGEESVTAHHGSLSKENRLDAETRLKTGGLKALVATASLELGIDIGHVDLVCQIGSPHRIATFLQRVGRSGHTVAGLPKGRLFPVSRDDLVECAALLRAVRRGELDRIVVHDAPLDVLAQQIVAESSCQEYSEEELFASVRRAWPYRALERKDFDAVLAMVSEGYATKRGRRGALVHRDEVNNRVRGRRGSRLLAITSGGAIPEVADYRVILEGEETFIGTLNEDFAIESSAGDIFQLGNTSWQIQQVGSGVVRVSDAKGAPPTIPFWLGEAPARSDELSKAVSDLRIDLETVILRGCERIESGPSCGGTTPSASLRLLHDEPASTRRRASHLTPSRSQAVPLSIFSQPLSEEGRAGVGEGSQPTQIVRAKTLNSLGSHVIPSEARDPLPTGGEERGHHDELTRVAPVSSTDRRSLITDHSVQWLIAESNIPESAALEIVNYLDEARRALGVLPTQETLVLERFFDESGGMQLVLHAPFGSRVNKAWGLALRKRFCRQFNFELQAAATEDAVLLSLGPQHSFPLADVFRYLHPATSRDVLVQAFLDAPVFQTRWRWNTTISLAVPRNRRGKKVPPQLQRTMSDDLMAAVFPDAAACFENIGGDRKLPDHPLVNQVVRDCLEEAMDFEGLARLLTRIHAGEVRLVARDTTEPSPLSHHILNAAPYAFLDDAPLEERRTQAVYTRRAGDVSANDLGALDSAAIERVRDEERPDPRDADELHDALLTFGVLTEEEMGGIAPELSEQLVVARRAGAIVVPGLVDSGVILSRRSAAKDPGIESREGRVAQPTRPSRDSTSGSFAVFAAQDDTRAPVARQMEGLPPREAGVILSRRSTAKDPEIESRQGGGHALYVAAERLPELLALHPHAARTTDLAPPPSRAARIWTREAALVELVRNRMALTGPITASEIAATLAVSEQEIDAALMALESEGVVLRGAFTEGAAFREAPEWCDRRLLARIHRYTLNRLRAEIEPVGSADFMRFLFAWQHVTPHARLTGTDGLRELVAQLDGFELAAGAWERSVLPARLDRYEASMLDMLCLTGEVGWARLSPPNPLPAEPRLSIKEEVLSLVPDMQPLARIVGATPVALFLRDHAGLWQALRGGEERQPTSLSQSAHDVVETLRTRGASFARDLAAACGLADDNLGRALGELVAAGLISSDGFSGLRALITAAHEKPRSRDVRANLAGRWSVVAGDETASRDEAVVAQAWTLLRRYGIVFRRLLTRETNAVPWRELARIYRRLEARGEIRGGRFVAGMSGEQFALPEAIERLREIRRDGAKGELVVISAADPLNLTGILNAGERIRVNAANRIAFRDGAAVSVIEGESLRPLADLDSPFALEAASALAGKNVNVASGWVGRPR
jgi:ATP-dependent Lhr-like helicase